MAGFSLGGGSGGGGDEEAPESLFQLYGGSGSASGTSRGFELWQQHQMQRQQQQHHPQLYSSTMLGFSSDQSHHHHHHQLAGSSSGSRGPAVRGSSSGGMSCQDCGNQSKKDCSHMRCRTCCKSRGFQCPTHVKSTWVAAAKRRDRQQQLTAAAAAQPPSSSQQHREQPQRLIEASKRPRELSTRRLPTAIATATSGGMETAMSFPSEVSSPAVFRCVRVSPMDEADDEYAYQTAVSIGGHVFKGILYDQGQESQYHHHHHHHSASADATAITTIGVGVGGASSSAAAVSAGLVNIDPSTLYPTPLSAFVAGTQFFPHHPRP